MVGLPASGKSTYANELAQQYNAEIFSSDKLREEMFGDINDQEHNAEVFQEMHKRIKNCLESGNSAVMDSTNISSKRRRAFVQELNNIKCEKHCVIMATPYEQCLENNKNRDRLVPSDVIDNMYRRWNTPAYFEGWDNIQVKYWDDSENSEHILISVYCHINDNQNNPHHTMTLGSHCLAAGNSFENDTLLNFAGLLHDIGKPYVKSFTNSKGETTEIAHYYGHENIAAYEALFFDYYGNANALDVSLLVNLHMQPYHWERDNNIKLRDKYKKLWGEELFDLVMKLHEADKAAH
jgi:predicted kinase